mmetsp:Transcript_17802/g.45071  ORF Transcript_17802/g.45071 Transcript_17802/m.45071 type:complete len:105 (+) Transcript_17802:2-316(+)
MPMVLLALSALPGVAGSGAGAATASAARRRGTGSYGTYKKGKEYWKDRVKPGRPCSDGVTICGHSKYCCNCRSHVVVRSGYDGELGQAVAKAGTWVGNMRCGCC